MPATFELFTKRRLPSQEQVTIYVHHTGSDSAAGTDTAPVASTEEALARIPSLLWGRRAVVRYLPGHVETIPTLFFPPLLGAGHSDDIAFDGEDPAWDFVRCQVSLEAAPMDVESVNGVVSYADATTGLLKITDASKSWTVNEHRGRLLYNPGMIAELAIIWANTATEIYTTGIGFSDGAMMIADRGANLTLGDAAANVLAGLLMNACHAPLAMIGLGLHAASDTGPVIDATCHNGVAFLGCEFAGGVYLRPGAGVVAFDGCYLHGGSWAPNGQPLAMRGSYLQGMTVAFHGSGGAGQYDFYGCRIDGCGSIGHGGTTRPEGGYDIDSCWIANGTGHGILYSGGNRARIRNTRIDACAGDALRADGTGVLTLSGITGSGSAGRGCYIDNGAHVLPTSVSVTGTQGDVILGGASGTPYTWAQAPQVHASRLCRFGL
jgi:hypothetical protein